MLYFYSNNNKVEFQSALLHKYLYITDIAKTLSGEVCRWVLVGLGAIALGKIWEIDFLRWNLRVISVVLLLSTEYCTFLILKITPVLLRLNVRVISVVYHNNLIAIYLTEILRITYTLWDWIWESSQLIPLTFQLII